MKISSVVLLVGLYVMGQPVRASLDKLHGKVTVSEVDQVQIELTIQPQMTKFIVAGAAPLAVGDYINFTISDNHIKLGEVQHQITGIEMTP